MPSKHKDKRRGKRANEAVVIPRTTSGLTVAIVGGGASGIATACSVAARARAAQADVRVVMIEAGRRLGSSILRSGNGRCNFSHADIAAAAFNHPVFVSRAFDALERSFAEPCSDGEHSVGAMHENEVLRWFARLGLVWREAPQSGGLLYPFSNKAISVLEVLQAELDRLGVEVCCGVAVSDITQQDGRFQLELRLTGEGKGIAGDAHSGKGTPNDGVLFAADRVVIACGGRAQPALDSLSIFKGLDRVAPVPVLGPLRTETTYLSGLDGIRARVRLSCAAKDFSEEGELLFRTYGVSGIVVFNASRFVETGDVIMLDFVPERPLERLIELLRKRACLLASERGAQPTYAELLQGFFLPEVALALIAFSAEETGAGRLVADSPVDEAGIETLARAIKGFALTVVGPEDPKQCQVIRGGISVDAIDTDTMEARTLQGAHLVGEALDVDGPCGGYNLHWAWASGLVAGAAIVRDLLEHSASDASSSSGA